MISAALALTALAAAVAPAPLPPDSDAPIIEDLAAASSNPDAAPVITCMLADVSGVGTARVFFRAAGQAGAFDKADLKGGTSGLFIARLPDGLQRSGFDYYVEATDVAGNGPARIGSPEAPIHVDRATEATLTRLAQQAADHKDPIPQIHPAWMMLSLGVGVLTGAGAGAYALDLAGVDKKVAGDDKILNDANTSAGAKKSAGANKTALEKAATQDTVITAILGVVSLASLATGIVLVSIGVAAGE